MNSNTRIISEFNFHKNLIAVVLFRCSHLAWFLSSWHIFWKLNQTKWLCKHAFFSSNFQCASKPFSRTLKRTKFVFSCNKSVKQKRENMMFIGYCWQAVTMVALRCAIQTWISVAEHSKNHASHNFYDWEISTHDLKWTVGLHWIFFCLKYTHVYWLLTMNVQFSEYCKLHLKNWILKASFIECGEKIKSWLFFSPNRAKVLLIRWPCLWILTCTLTTLLFFMNVSFSFFVWHLNLCGAIEVND